MNRAAKFKKKSVQARMEENVQTEVSSQIADSETARAKEESSTGFGRRGLEPRMQTSADRKTAKLIRQFIHPAAMDFGIPCLSASFADKRLGTMSAWDPTPPVMLKAMGEKSPCSTCSIRSWYSRRFLCLRLRRLVSYFVLW